MKTINKKRIGVEYLMIGIIGIMLLIPIISAGYSSDYYSGNPATVGPGETKMINLFKLMSSTGDANNGNVKDKVEVVDGAGIASIEGSNEFSVTPTNPVQVPVKLSVPKDTPEGTKYTLTFKITDMTPTSDTGMIGFARSTTLTMDVYVKTPTAPPVTTEKPMGSIAWVIIILVLAIIIAIVAYLLVGRKNTSGKSK